MHSCKQYYREIIERQFAERQDNLVNEIRDWIDKELEDYNRFSPLVEENEIKNIEDLETVITDGWYNITEVTEDTVLVDIHYNVNIKCNVEHGDPESFHYESEDKSSFFGEQKTTSVDRDVTLISVYKLGIRSESDYEKDFELEFHNNNEPLAFG